MFVEMDDIEGPIELDCEEKLKMDGSPWFAHDPQFNQEIFTDESKQDDYVTYKNGYVGLKCDSSLHGGDKYNIYLPDRVFDKCIKDVDEIPTEYNTLLINNDKEDVVIIRKFESIKTGSQKRVFIVDNDKYGKFVVFFMELSLVSGDVNSSLNSSILLNDIRKEIITQITLSNRNTETCMYAPCVYYVKFITYFMDDKNNIYNNVILVITENIEYDSYSLNKRESLENDEYFYNVNLQNVLQKYDGMECFYGSGVIPDNTDEIVQQIPSINFNTYRSKNETGTREESISRSQTTEFYAIYFSPFYIYHTLGLWYSICKDKIEKVFDVLFEMHMNNIFHHDLNEGNVFADMLGNITLIDFGLSRGFEETYNTIQRTYLTMSAIMESRYYNDTIEDNEKHYEELKKYFLEGGDLTRDTVVAFMMTELTTPKSLPKSSTICRNNMKLPPFQFLNATITSDVIADINDTPYTKYALYQTNILDYSNEIEQCKDKKIPELNTMLNVISEKVNRKNKGIKRVFKEFIADRYADYIMLGL